MLSNRGAYWRQIIIRYVEGDEGTTPETRAEGLRILRDFFLDANNTKFPPSDILTEDVTNVEDPEPLDNYFIDEDIEAFMKEDIAEADLNASFVTRFPDTVRRCWSRGFVSQWARGIGFPTAAAAQAMQAAAAAPPQHNIQN